jgi:hypothetical protein
MSKVAVFKFFVVVCILSMLSGCASVMSYNAGAKEQAMRIAKAKNDPTAIQFIAMGGNAVGVGIEVGSWDVIAAHPWRSLGAALLDVGTGVGMSKLLDNYTSNSTKKNVTITGNGNSYNETTGDGNTSTHSNENESHNTMVP